MTTTIENDTTQNKTTQNKTTQNEREATGRSGAPRVPVVNAAVPGDASADGASEQRFLWEVMAAFAFEFCDQLFWRVDDGHLSIYVTCNDVFAWGCSDVEEIRPENLPLLLETKREAEARKRHTDWPLLWVARVRQSRPQGAMYKYLDEELHSLFDACGEERPVGQGNPVAR